MASMSNPVQQLLNAEKKAAIVVNDARSRKYEDICVSSLDLCEVYWIAEACPSRGVAMPKGVSRVIL